MDTGTILAIVAPIASALLLGVLGWSLTRNVKGLDKAMSDMSKQMSDIATDVRQLASQGARHGESLAAGVQQFKSVEKRLDKLEEKQEQFQADCIACRTERHT